MGAVDGLASSSFLETPTGILIKDYIQNKAYKRNNYWLCSVNDSTLLQNDRQ